MIAAAILLATATATAAPPSKAAAAVKPPGPCDNVRNKALCRDLNEIYDRDQEVHKKWFANQNSKAINAEVKKVDTANVARVRAILNQFGWPGKTLVGEKASAAAWTIVQRGGLEMQKANLDLMTKAADAGELRWALVATAIDRIAVREGRPQTYGTSFQQVKGSIVFDPIEDEANVDERRSKVGLPPLADYRRTVEDIMRKK